MSLEQALEIQSVIDNLKGLDDVYAGIEKELRQKVSQLRKDYESKFAAVIADRATILSKKGLVADDAHATPAIPGFWLDVLANSEEFNEDIEEYDEPVLEYLESIEAVDTDPTDEDKGFVLTFKFNENPFFTNKELRKVYTTARVNEFTDQLEIVKIESDKIDWKAGQDVTVETVTKKKSGGGKKKKASSKIQPRPSFFRYFKDLDADNLPSDFGGDNDEEEDDYEGEEETELERLQMFMEHDWDRANTLKELIIPRAIRWYTGEAVEADEEEGDDEDEDDEDDDEEDSEDEDEEETPKGKAGAKKLFAAAKAAGKNPEECKQQ